MLMYGRKFKLTQELMDVIASYMNDEIREDLHSKMAPCEPERFLKEYAKRDSEFMELLWPEFGIEIKR